MAAPGKQSKWGSFLSQAVAGVESRLDNILADADGDQTKQATATPGTLNKTASQPSPQKRQQLAPPDKEYTPQNSRSSSSNRTNDRLQARLAQAMAGKSGSAPGSRATASPRSSVDQPSASTEALAPTPVPEADTEGTATKSEEAKDEPDTVGEAGPGPVHGEESDAVPDVAADEADPDPEALDPTDGVDISHETPSAEPAALMPDAATDRILESEGNELDQQLEEIKAQHQSEIQEYVERVDSLQSKLQYLSKVAAESAKKDAASTPAGSSERKLAEKDEKIALLMQEGRQLSTNEGKYRSTIKKLRSQAAEHEKQAEEWKKRLHKASSDALALRNRLSDEEETEKRKEETRRATAALQKDIDSLKQELARKDDTIRRIEQDSRTKADQAEQAHKEAASKSLAAERQKQKELQDANATLRAEKEAAAEKAQHDRIEWQEKHDRAVERSRKIEEELKLELQAMEGKLETMRATAEEASSGSGGEAQVKMFRQIETLQSQYASARENWQGIESSLLAKTANLEKERDEAQRRESEMRKKARDATTKSRHLEEELQDVQPSLKSVRQELESCRDELSALQASYKSSEAALEEARSELEAALQRTASKEDSSREERQQWVDDVAGASSRDIQSQPESPMLSVSRTFSSDILGFGGPPKARRSRNPSIADGPIDILSSMRRFSGQPLQRAPGSSNTGSGPPPLPFSPFEGVSEPTAPPSPPPPAEKENGVPDTIPSSPRHIAQDMVSVSTVAAGPSVQLVERMSAAIRRLEAEKVSAKEDMARVCSQRDEARTDMVALMKELEDTKAAAAKVPELENEVSNIDQRYQTTLEMLGEKSELVEELKADVQDVKEMYRELVERTVK